MTDAISRATSRVSEGHLQRMVLERHQLPHELQHFEPVRQWELDNATMAEQSFPGNTAESLRQMGRVTGYAHEFASPVESPVSWEGADALAATVVHLFDDEDGVSRWMTDVFRRQFEENTGKPMWPGQKVVAVEPVVVRGLNDESVALRAVQTGPSGLVSSTVVDFRVGRLLGVAYVVTIGDFERRELAETLAISLEQQMVRQVLGLP